MLEILVADYVMSVRDGFIQMWVDDYKYAPTFVYERVFQDDLREFLLTHVAPHIILTRMLRCADLEKVLSTLYMDAIRKLGD